VRQKKGYLIKLFRDNGIYAHRKLGQCFLIDHNLQQILIDAADFTSEDYVLEVGTGTGQLTELMVEKAGHVLSVEIDKKLFHLAHERMADTPNVELLHTDVLAGKNTIHPDVTDRLRRAHKAGKTLKLVANLPYCIALPLIQNLLESDLPLTLMVVTVQKEFALKMIAEPGGRGPYGAFSILFQARARARVLRTLPASVFWPVPKVESAIVSIEPASSLPAGLDYGLFRSLVRQAFTGRRKKLTNALKAWFSSLDLEAGPMLDQAGVSRDVRPERVSIQEFIKIVELATLARPS